MKKLFDKDEIIHGISLIGGKEYIPASQETDIAIDYTYTGVDYNLFIYSGFLEIGPKYSFGEEKGDTVQLFKYLTIQFGYIFSFK